MNDINGSVQEFYELLLEIHGITPLDSKIHHFIRSLQSDLSTNAQKLLYIYLSLLNDGNTRISLNPEALSSKWRIKWDGLTALSQIEHQNAVYPNADNFNAIIASGINDIKTKRYNNIIEERTECIKTPAKATTKPFVLHDDYLYAVKYFDAKCIIEQASKRIFNSIEVEISDAERQKYNAIFSKALRADARVAPSERQLDAIIRGQRENLIITGGPGTGKTTVICFLLWKLLQSEQYQNWKIYLSAPSGKAADRIRESMLKSIEDFEDKSNPAYQIIHALEGTTLHRLLNYNPATNHFLYHENNPFPENSIFVVDEASMIDIELFADFMAALPQNCRLFILGDADQLPSVNAGAVLGEMLNSNGCKCAIKLNVSHRFNDNSQIGHLACSIKRAKEDGKNVVQTDDFVNYTKHLTLWPKDKKDQINYIKLTHSDIKKTEMQLKKLIHAWCERFYTNLANETEKIDPLQPPFEQLEQLNTVWEIAEQARILSAERQGLFGIQTINRVIKEYFKIQSNEPFYNGQMLMLTKNQELFKLYNGDSGIVVRERNSGRYHLLLKKVQTKKSDRLSPSCNYIFYPLSVLPMDALESAFAITIHKSQGSGYKNIMMFLPHNTAHPLLNNQIIYTGITRTEEISLTIVTDADVFNAGCRKNIERDTGIQF